MGGNREDGVAVIEHRRDPDDEGTFIKHVGWVYLCTCGLDNVAGYPCPGDRDGAERGHYADGRLDPYWRPAELLRQEDVVIGEIVAAYTACHAWSGDQASQHRQHASIAIATLQRLGWGPVSGGGPG